MKETGSQQKFGEKWETKLKRLPNQHPLFDIHIKMTVQPD